MKRSKILLLLCEANATEYRMGMNVRQGIFERALEGPFELVDLYFSENHFPDDLKSVAGMITRFLPDDPRLDRIKDAGVPILRCGRFSHQKDDLLHTVLPNWKLIAQMAATHFLERGHVNLGIVAQSSDADYRELYSAYEEELSKHGIECSSFLFHPYISRKSISYEKRVKDFLSWVQEQPKPLALFTGQDVLACKLLSMCISHGISVPEEVSILCVNYDEITCQIMPISVSSIRLDVVEQGRKAMDCLERITKDRPDDAIKEFYSPEVCVERRSTQFLSGVTPSVEKAVRFIWDHFREPITVDTIARQALVSRRKLELEFRKHFKRSVGEELRRKRLEEARYLLKTTDRKIEEIAISCGMGEVSTLHKAFRKEFSMTPREYRKA